MSKEKRIVASENIELWNRVGFRCGHRGCFGELTIPDELSSGETKIASFRGDVNCGKCDRPSLIDYGVSEENRKNWSVLCGGCGDKVLPIPIILVRGEVSNTAFRGTVICSGEDGCGGINRVERCEVLFCRTQETEEPVRVLKSGF